MDTVVVVLEILVLIRGPGQIRVQLRNRDLGLNCKTKNQEHDSSTNGGLCTCPNSQSSFGVPELQKWTLTSSHYLKYHKSQHP